jgi:cell division protein ZapA
MAEVSITMNGRIYEISCDNGQEGRVVDLAAYVDQKLQQIARSGAAYNDAHLMVLTLLVMADEVFEEREGAASARPVVRTPQGAIAPAQTGKDDETLVKLLDQITRRVEGIASRVQAA